VVKQVYGLKLVLHTYKPLHNFGEGNITRVTGDCR
jgi:hypothetical protein